MADTRTVTAPPRTLRTAARRTRTGTSAYASVVPPVEVASSSRKRRPSANVHDDIGDQVASQSMSDTCNATVLLSKRHRRAPAATAVCAHAASALSSSATAAAVCTFHTTPQSVVPTPTPAPPPSQSSPTASVAPPAVSRVASASPKVFVELSAERAFEPACGLRTPTPRHSIIASLIEDNRQLQKERVSSSASPSPLLVASLPPMHAIPPPTVSAVLASAVRAHLGASCGSAPACSTALVYHAPQFEHSIANGTTAAQLHVPTPTNYYQQMAHAFMASSDFAFFAPPSVSTAQWGVVAQQ